MQQDSYEKYDIRYFNPNFIFVKSYFECKNYDRTKTEIEFKI